MKNGNFLAGEGQIVSYKSLALMGYTSRPGGPWEKKPEALENVILSFNCNNSDDVWSFRVEAARPAQSLLTCTLWVGGIESLDEGRIGDCERIAEQIGAFHGKATVSWRHLSTTQPNKGDRPCSRI